jgi:hypothetical protein
MQVARDAADVGGREALAASVNPDRMPAEGAALGQLDAGGVAAEGAQESAMLADCVNGSVAHTWGMSESVPG